MGLAVKCDGAGAVAGVAACVARGEERTEVELEGVGRTGDSEEEVLVLLPSREVKGKEIDGLGGREEESINCC
jgi:hypothetical protein